VDAKPLCAMKKEKNHQSKNRMSKIIKMFLGLIGLFILVCLIMIRKYPIENKEMNYEEIKSFNSMEDLTVYELLRLASSKEQLDSIFLTRDTSITLFKRQIQSGYKFPMIVLRHEKEKNVSENEIEKIENLLNGNNNSYQIVSELASRCELMDSSVGTEAEFILRRLKGEGIFCSSIILKHEYLNRLVFKLGIEM
jgi:hypothetical protein